MIESSDFRMTRIPLNHGGGHMPAVGFGTLIPDAAETIGATRDALEAGFRHFDCAERYRNEREVGEALQAGLAAGGIAREDIFVTTKLWNSNHRPERVEPAFEASLDRLGLNYLDLYLIHTPFSFQPGDEQDPRDQNGNVLEAGAARRSSRWVNRRASWKDASTGAAGLGGAARHGFAYHAQDSGPRARESQHLRPSGRRA
jgi:alcohol dehydrogenase (NADP+)